VRVRHLPMISRVWDHPAFPQDTPPAQYLAELYLRMLDEGRGTIAESLRLISEPGGLPAVFYCAAGKDRTGVLAALVLGAIRVSPEVIIEDYGRSAEPVARMQQRALSHAELEPGSRVQPALSFPVAPPAAMGLLLAAIDEAHGSMPAYLNSIGVTSEISDGLAAALLE
jgi:protein-tyrosine phosphatase